MVYCMFSTLTAIRKSKSVGGNVEKLRSVAYQKQSAAKCEKIQKKRSQTGAPEQLQELHLFSKQLPGVQLF